MYAWARMRDRPKLDDYYSPTKQKVYVLHMSGEAATRL